MKAKMSGITKRWIKGTLMGISFLIIAVSVVVLIFVKNYYNNTVSMTLLSNDTDLLSTFFNVNSIKTDEDFYETSREYIENFESKDLMEVWIIDDRGKVILSSTGFAVTDNVEMPDYNMALTSPIGRGEWSGKYMTGEPVSTMTTVLPSREDKPIGAIRYIVSKRGINQRFAIVALIVMAVCLMSIGLVVASGLFFLKSIVRPISDINNIARRIAEGDYAARIKGYRQDDEIGELSKTINYMAEEIGSADKAKNDFISTISHELRTPLTAIKGWGETILQVCESDYALTKRGIEVIIGESRRLSGMVEELLDFSRMQDGRLIYNKEKIDVLAELDETIFIFKERALREGIELVYNSTDMPAPMMGDPGRIKQVFVNIIDNSFKYTEQGGKVTVLAEIVDSDLIITVSDTGCGISKEDLSKVKQKFYKANTSVRGSGIGLAVADEIVKKHGGELTVDSIVGLGTTVKISLPIEPVPLANNI
ncbi:MAG: HAMP domain-containing histidine kinase [Clostridiales bacterium]|nr:HAMP domain-containing histidine kinase [Clostridiales bacterium]